MNQKQSENTDVFAKLHTSYFRLSSLKRTENKPGILFIEQGNSTRVRHLKYLIFICFV